MKPRRKRKQKNPDQFIDKSLLSVKKVPQSIINADKIAEQLLGKKIKLKNKTSYKFRLAIKNYQAAVTRAKRSSTLLEKHYKTLSKLANKYL